MPQVLQGVALDGSNYAYVDLAAGTMVGAPGSAAPAAAILIGGSDGTDLRSWLMSATGQGHVITDSGSTTAVSGTVAINVTQVGGTTISATNPLFTEITDGTNALGAFAHFGTSPGAVYAAGVNASIMAGTTALSATGSSLNVNITGGASSGTEYTNGTTPYGSPATLEGGAALGVDPNGEVHVINTDTLGNQTFYPAAPTLSELSTVAINTAASGSTKIQVVAGVSAKTVRIMELSVQIYGLGAGSVTCTFQDGASTALTGPYEALNGFMFGRDNNGDPLFICSTTGAGSGFVISVSGTCQVSGYAKYTQS